MLAFENYEQRTSNKRYYSPNVAIKDCSVMIDGKNFFHQPVKNDQVTYEKILGKLLLVPISKNIKWFQ